MGHTNCLSVRAGAIASLALSSTILLSTTCSWAAEKNPSPARTPAELVQAALKTELDGPSAARETLLRQALELDPEFAPARWHLGFVRFNDQWMTLDEVAKRVGSDETLREYRQRRDALVDTADNQREMARWCHKQKLLDEERVHWAKVLEFEPQDSEALAALGLQLYDGRLLTKAQIAEAKKQEAEIRRATKEWTPKLLKWRRAIESGSTKDRLAALQELQKLSDPNVIPALEATFAEKQSSKTGDARNRLLIETVGRMPFPAATQALLRRAILPDSEAIRNAAADELKKRPMHAYVPQLIAALPSPGPVWTTNYQVNLLPNGSVSVAKRLLLAKDGSQHQVNYELILDYRTHIVSEDIPQLNKQTVNTRAALNDAWRRIRDGQQVDLELARRQAEERARSQRLQATLRLATGWAGGDEPIQWVRQWTEYNETYAPSHLYQPEKYPEQTREDYAQYVRHVNLLVVSCFPAGTPILSMTGYRPIEEVRIGDRVLSQHPATGELAFEAVQATTLRPAAPLLRFTIGPHTIRATRGHPFWVTGRAWQLAKHVKVGDRLHTVYGAALVDAIDEEPPAEAYNLVVSGYHNYFAGETGLLVHDNAPLGEVIGAVPGLALHATAAVDTEQ